MSGAIPPLPQYDFMAWCLVKSRGKLYIFLHLPCYVGACHHGMARPRVADGGDGLQLWEVDAKVLNKQSRTAEKGGSLASWSGRGQQLLTKEIAYCEMLHRQDTEQNVWAKRK
jgi:hypothetical protein